MKNLYTKLAVDGIKNNSKLYFPYMLSIAGVAAIYYILTYLVSSEALTFLNGGSVLFIILIMGKAVIIIFSLLFLFYTNSFLAKKRNKEFALYNILGMNKKNVVKILAREALIEGVVSILGGVLLGVLFSKFFELLLCKLCGHEPDFMFYFSPKPIFETIIFFGVIILVLFIFSVFKVAINKPIELLRSTNSGEKEPKANFVLGLLGFVVLAFAYFVSLSIKSPMEGLLKFFGAVIMVIAATYALFVAGSVCLCKILKKNTNFYYSKKHFISVSGMAYRMKRNGAGLASICILSTMVLVMVASTGSLLIGKEDSLRKIYPKEILLTVRMDKTDNAKKDALTDENVANVEAVLDEITKDVPKKNPIGIRQLSSLAALGEDEITIVNSKNRELVNDLDISFVCIYPAEDYFKYEPGEGLKDNEALVAYTGKNVAKNITIGDRQYEVVGKPDSKNMGTAMSALDSASVVVNDFDHYLEFCDDVEATASPVSYVYGFDTGLSDDENIALGNRLRDEVNVRLNEELGCFTTVEVRADEAKEFMELYGGLFLLGIFLSISFILACVLIMYYKQITEGYEDASNYSIMRKVGMTKKEIKSGIKTQTLVTFFSPLLLAGLHLFFSFPIVLKLLNIFGIIDLKLLLSVYGGFFLLFALFYYFVYKRTVKAYLEIVSY